MHTLSRSGDTPVGPADAADTAEDAVMMVMLTLGRQMRQRLPGDDIDYSSIPLLTLVARRGPLRLSEVACTLGLDASTVSRSVRHLQDRGLLERTEDPDDGRASRIAVSAQGGDCLARVFASRRELVAGLLEGWTDQDREHLRVLLQRLSAAVPDPATR